MYEGSPGTRRVVRCNFRERSDTFRQGVNTRTVTVRVGVVNISLVQSRCTRRRAMSQFVPLHRDELGIKMLSCCR